MKTIAIISLGTDLSVPAAAQAALASAELVIGGQRHLDAVDCGSAETQVYSSPLNEMAAVLLHSEAQKVAILASGDALFFGIGSWLLRHCSDDDLRFYPNVTTVQTACARIGRPWQNLQFVSLHGRPLARLRALLGLGISLAVFTDTANTPAVIAQELVGTGYAESTVYVCEALDSEAEQVREFSAQNLATTESAFDPLNLLIIDVRGAGGLLPAFPGIDDAIFAEGGDSMFTKREVRLAALSRLALGGGETGWDIGAGSGGIAIEWARWQPSAQVNAIERDEKRRHFFEINRARFGDHGNLVLHAGDAMDVIEHLSDPDAIYVGGSGGHLDDLLDRCWQRLKPGGRMVIAGVTVETRAQLQARQWPVDVAFSDIAISHSAALGSQTTMRAQLPVLLATVIKP